ncbi:MAG TPA: T9SS type A sorting domain-containing protein [Ignavibacteriaceae bacterium]
MKSGITFLLIYFFFSTASAQILNPSFEDWNAFDPVNWSTFDDVGGIDGITESSDAHEGSSSVRMEVVDLGGFAFPPYLWSIDDNGNYHPVSQKHGSFKGRYKFSPQGNDQLYIVVGMLDSDSSVVGAGAFPFQAAASNWTEFDIPIYYNPGTPDPVQTFISIGIYDSTGQTNAGSFALIDHLSFTDPSAVEQISGLPKDFSLSQNYPNPFNPTINIEYTIPEASFVQLKVYDILGNEVATLVNEEQSAGTYRADFTAENIASGFYVAQLRAGDFSKTIKMTLMK